MSNFNWIEKVLAGKIGKYSKCISNLYLDFNYILFTKAEINAVLAKKNGWMEDELVFCAMARGINLINCDNFNRPIVDIAIIMMIIREMHITYCNKYLKSDKIYSYALTIYKNMCPDEIILYNTLLNFNYSSYISSIKIYSLCAIMATAMIAWLAYVGLYLECILD